MRVSPAAMVDAEGSDGLRSIGPCDGRVDGGSDGGPAADPEVLRPRVPSDQIESARAVTNPLPSTPEMLGRGKALFEGKALCRACHGSEGKGLGMDLDYSAFKGPLPRNFTDGCGNRRGRLENYCGF